MDKELLKQYYEEGKKFGYALARGATDLPSVQTFDELYTKHLHKPVVSGKRPEQDLRDFFIWAVRVAKIEVIDAENAIELTGYWKEDAPLVPVLSLDELIQEYQAATDTELYKETKT